MAPEFKTGVAERLERNARIADDEFKASPKQVVLPCQKPKDFAAGLDVEVTVEALFAMEVEATNEPEPQLELDIEPDTLGDPVFALEADGGAEESLAVVLSIEEKVEPVFAAVMEVEAMGEAEPRLELDLEPDTLGEPVFALEADGEGEESLVVLLSVEETVEPELAAAKVVESPGPLILENGR